MDGFSWYGLLGFRMPGNELAHAIILLYSEILIIGFLIWLIVIAFITLILYKFNINSIYWLKHRNESNYKTFYYSKKMESFLDVFFVIVPTLIVVLILVLSLSFLYKYEYHLDVSRVDFSIDVIGHQWYWSYKYSVLPLSDWLSELSEPTHMLYCDYDEEEDTYSIDPLTEYVWDMDVYDSFIRDIWVERLGLPYNYAETGWFLHNQTNIFNKHRIWYQYMIPVFEVFAWKHEFVQDTAEGVDEDVNIEFDSILDPEGAIRLLSVDNNLMVPSNTYINMCITSTDVIHSWSVPQLGIKMDAVPGRINNVILSAMDGIFYGQCSELCGVRHGFMPIVVEAVPADFFVKWYFLQIDYRPWWVLFFLLPSNEEWYEYPTKPLADGFEDELFNISLDLGDVYSPDDDRETRAVVLVRLLIQSMLSDMFNKTLCIPCMTDPSFPFKRIVYDPLHYQSFFNEIYFKHDLLFMERDENGLSVADRVMHHGSDEDESI